MTEIFNLIPDPTDVILFWGILVISFLLSAQIIDRIMGKGTQPSMFWVALFCLWGGTLTFAMMISAVIFDYIF